MVSEHVEQDRILSLYSRRTVRVSTPQFPQNPACWEGVTHEDVLALFDRAIEECVSQTTDDMFEVEPKARTFHKGVVRLVDRSTDYIDECKSNGDLK